MKFNTRNIIASVMATAVLGAAVGISAFALGKNENNDFGLRGTYSLAAFVVATPYTVTVDGVAVDVTTTYSVVSEDRDYKLYFTVVDVHDLDALTNVAVGYSIDDGEQLFNGKIVGTNNSGLTNVVYSSLTVNTEYDTTETIDATAFADKFENITTPKFIIAEVQISHLAFNNEATVAISGKKVK